MIVYGIDSFFSEVVLSKLNRESGLLGLAGSADSRDVEEAYFNNRHKGFRKKINFTVPSAENAYVEEKYRIIFNQGSVL